MCLRRGGKYICREYLVSSLEGVENRPTEGQTYKCTNKRYRECLATLCDGRVNELASEKEYYFVCVNVHVCEKGRERRRERLFA